MDIQYWNVVRQTSRGYVVLYGPTTKQEATRWLMDHGVDGEDYVEPAEDFKA